MRSLTARFRTTFWALAGGLSLFTGAFPAHAQDATIAKEVAPGIYFYKTTQRTSINSEVTIWAFLPKVPSGKVGCIVIAPAGTPEIYGSHLGNPPEYLPYVRAGFAVVAYSLDGSVENRQSVEQVVAGHQLFQKAGAGLVDTYAAIDFITTRLPQVDPARIYAAGHSSAGTLALLAAEQDPRIKGCLAYAPRTDLVKEKQDIIQELKPSIPDIASFYLQTSPTTWVKKLRCPLFLYSSTEDHVVSTSSVAAFASKVSATNGHVTFVRTQNGDHYDSMINDGIPRGIAWLKALDARLAAHRH